ncbi:MAG: hypothetical protein LUG50_11805 [Planctomycetaceae bacterium]|nr:hypothetical protein [Planctomycetaceae bacterium]
MGYLITFLIVCTAVLVLVVKAVRANRAAALREKQRREELERRREKEQEVLDRLKKIKDPLTSAKKVIDRDPERAAKVLSNMMKKK